MCVCVCVFSSTAMFFFCLCHNRIEKFRRPGNFFPSGEKNFLVCSSFGLGRLSSFLGEMGGGKEVNAGQHLPCCFYLRLLLDTLCVIRKLLRKSVGQSTTQSIRGMGSKEVNEKASTYHAVSICVCY